jgi:hypothetical protein
MRPTDVCHPNDLRAPAPRAFPARSRHFRGGESPRSLGLRVALPGTWTFHDVLGSLRRIESTDTLLVLYCLTAWRNERGRFLPTVTLRSSL